MKNTSIILFISLFSLFLVSCTSSKKAASPKPSNKEISEKERYQASDLFVKAISTRELGSLTSALDLLNQAEAINPTDGAIH